MVQVSQYHSIHNNIDSNQTIVFRKHSLGKMKINYYTHYGKCYRTSLSTQSWQMHLYATSKSLLPQPLDTKLINSSRVHRLINYPVINVRDKQLIKCNCRDWESLRRTKQGHQQRSYQMTNQQATATAALMRRCTMPTCSSDWVVGWLTDRLHKRCRYLQLHLHKWAL